MTPRGHGGYFLRIDAWAYWEGVRLPVERIPPGLSGRLTVFKHLSLANSSSGPVAVELSAAAEAHLARVANSLPVQPPLGCMEDALVYVLALHPRSGTHPHYQLQGWACGAEVLVTLDDASLSPLGDRDCSLLELVKSLTPPSAGGTRHAAAGCTPEPEFIWFRIKGRLAVDASVPEKSLRKIEIQVSEEPARRASK